MMEMFVTLVWVGGALEARRKHWTWGEAIIWPASLGALLVAWCDMKTHREEEGSGK